MRIAIQGTHGSFHDEAAHHIDKMTEIVPCTTFTGVFQAVEHGRANHGLVAIENSLHGSINEVYRLLERHHVWITHDIRMHITQNLIGHKGISIGDLRAHSDSRVLSQGPALAQVELWLDKNLPQAIREETHDTADSVRLVMESDDVYATAVAGSHAAKTYGGTIIAKNIEDDPHNYTRFILFQKDKTVTDGATHGSIILKTDHTPGALLRALSLFAEHSSNLIKLDSHPIPGDKRHYAFYIDYELPNGTNQAMLEALTDQGCSVKVLGEYLSVK